MFWLPTPLVVFLVMFVVAVIIERYTTGGRTAHAIGGNAEAARLSGLGVRSTQTVLYVLTGASGGVILGGASLAGGRGTVIGALIAVAILGMLSDGFALLLWFTSAQTIALGVALIVAVLWTRPPGDCEDCHDRTRPRLSRRYAKLRVRAR